MIYLTVQELSYWQTDIQTNRHHWEHYLPNVVYPIMAITWWLWSGHSFYRSQL